MKLAAVITSSNYGDFLAWTLPHNCKQFHYAVVCTTPEDVRTQKVCEFWNVHCIKVPEFHDGGGFRKGAGINAGLRVLKEAGMDDGWVVHMDADIFLPPHAGGMIGRANLDPTFLYGADRQMVKSFEDWCDYLSFPTVQYECKAYVHHGPFQTGTRVLSVDPGYDGYVPIGFFQMWCPSVSGVTKYPEEHTTAGRGDMLFARNWPRAKRALIPEFIPFHLESEVAPMGANWAGRKTKLFGPTRCPEPAPEPYMTPEEVAAVEKLLLAHCPKNKTASVLEWGSGGSTVAFPKFLKANGRSVNWLAVEHDSKWAERVIANVIAGVRVVNIKTDGPQGWKPYIEPEAAKGKKFDVVIVDGRMRRRCMAMAAGLLAEGGIVILHDAERPYYHPAFDQFEGSFVTPRLWVGKAKGATPPCPPPDYRSDPARLVEGDVKPPDSPGAVGFRIHVKSGSGVVRSKCFAVGRGVTVSLDHEDGTEYAVTAVFADGSEEQPVFSPTLAMVEPEDDDEDRPERAWW